MVTIMGEAHAYSELFSEEQKMKNSNLLQSSLAHFGHPRGKKNPSAVLWQNSYWKLTQEVSGSKSSHSSVQMSPNPEKI